MAKDLPVGGRPASGACDVLGRTCARAPARRTIPPLRGGDAAPSSENRRISPSRPSPSSHFLSLWGSCVRVLVRNPRGRHSIVTTIVTEKTA